MSAISKRDAEVVWHPYTQMKLEPLATAIVRGSGALLFDEDGKRYIDAISSWWVTLHGHANSYINQKIAEQLAKLEQVIFAGFTHEPAVRLAERLISHLPNSQKRIFFSDNGSTAVEVALKMVIQYWKNLGETKRKRIVAFEGGYHGDTFGAMSLAGGAFSSPFSEYLFNVTRIPIPTKEKPGESLARLEAELSRGDAAGFIFEPLVLGASGMKMYDAKSLNDLVEICKKYKVLTIADEVMTGFGRTGKIFACHNIAQSPDIVCLSKGITGGYVPFGATSCTKEIFEAFLSDSKERMFIHGHSYTGNPVACAAGNASLDLLEKIECDIAREEIARISDIEIASLSEIKNVKNLRRCGTITAFEVDAAGGDSYFNSIRDTIYAACHKRGVLIRPLGKTIYVLPPYCITSEELKEVFFVIKDVVRGLK